MTYSDSELQQIEKFASIYLKISDMAVILDIPADVLRSDITDRSTNVSNAHRNLLDMEDDNSRFFANFAI